MKWPHLSRRAALLGGAGGAGAAWLLLRSGERPNETPPASQARFDLRSMPPEGGRVVLDPARFPTRFQEAPDLARLVAQGALPPVERRIGLDPLVIAPLHEIGRYGGTIRRAFVGTGDTQGVLRFASGPDSLLYWDVEWRNVMPNIARAFEFSEDDRVLTLRLRRGMRWSDGAPFTADDILFWYEDMYLDRRVVARASGTMQIAGQPVRIEREDAETVRFVSPRPYPSLSHFLAGYSDLAGPSVAGRAGLGGFAPRHYLKRFHPKYRPEDELTREAREQGFANWSILLKNRNDWMQNPELPVVSPWRTTVPINRQTMVMERNPYSIWVDTAGNQLPYVDRVTHSLCSGPEAVNFKAAVGTLDFQDRHLFINKLPFLLSNRARSDYDVHLDPYEGCDLGVRLNLDYREDPVIGELLANLTFRKALSLAVDRDAINEAFMLGTGLPTSAVPAPDNKFYPGDEWARLWAGRDVAAANRLLDTIGLARRDRQGFRLRPDRGGRLRLVCQAVVAHFDYPGVAEMLRDQWREIGLDLDVQVVETTLWLQRAAAGSMQVALQLTGSDDPITFPDLLFPSTTSASGGVMGVRFAMWFQSNGREGARPPPGIVDIMRRWRAALEMPDAERIEAGKALIRSHVEQLLSIGLISRGLSLYGIRVAKTSLGNVPRRILNSNTLKGPANALPMTFFYRV